MHINKRIMNGDMTYICERIAKTYIETGRTMRSLAKLYRCSVTSIYRYLKEYSQQYLDWDLYRQVNLRSTLNKQEVYLLGQSENRYSSALGGMD